MENGAIVEQGTHDQLLAKKGAYARLYEAQFAAPIDDEANLAADAAGRQPALVGAPPSTAEIVREALAEEGDAPEQ